FSCCRTRLPPRSTPFPYTTLFRSNEPEAGVYNNIVIFERSLVPAGRAANYFTALHVHAKEKRTMATAEKLAAFRALLGPEADAIDRKSTRLNSSHVKISYAGFCLK